MRAVKEGCAKIARKWQHPGNRGGDVGCVARSPRDINSLHHDQRIYIPQEFVLQPPRLQFKNEG
jgi:hypothetical protein